MLKYLFALAAAAALTGQSVAGPLCDKLAEVRQNIRAKLGGGCRVQSRPVVAVPLAPCQSAPAPVAVVVRETPAVLPPPQAQPAPAVVPPRAVQDCPTGRCPNQAFPAGWNRFR